MALLCMILAPSALLSIINLRDSAGADTAYSPLCLFDILDVFCDNFAKSLSMLRATLPSAPVPFLLCLLYLSEAGSAKIQWLFSHRGGKVIFKKFTRTTAIHITISATDTTPINPHDSQNNRLTVTDTSRFLPSDFKFRTL